MKKIILERGKGKTTELIKLSAETQNYIVCGSLDECSYVFSIAKELELDIPFPISYDEFLRKEYSPNGIKGFLIDNADSLLQRMSSVPINAISLTSNTRNQELIEKYKRRIDTIERDVNAKSDWLTGKVSAYKAAIMDLQE